MTHEDEISLLLSVSVSDVAPQNDHAARALTHHHARVVKRRIYAGAAATITLVAVAVSTVVMTPHPRDFAAASRWQRHIGLDGGRVLIGPPADGDAMSLSAGEARTVVQRGRSADAIEIVASRWGRVTVNGQDGKPLPGFDNVVAWATVFRQRGESRMCPGTPSPAGAAVDPGDFAQTQVIVMTSDGSSVRYSQAGAWLCGLPVQPVAEIAEMAG